MNSKITKWTKKLYPSELEHAIETILMKYERKNREDVELIDAMFDELQIKKEFERLVNYNKTEEGEDWFRIKKIFKNVNYEQQFAQLEFNVHLNNGTFDRVVQKVREYHMAMKNNTRIGETLENLKDYEKFLREN
jgi:hypothetical protein